MKTLKIIVVGFVLTSCCSGLFGDDECVQDDYLYFRIFATTGEELFTGTNPKYTVDDLKLYSVVNGTRLDLGNIYAETDQLWTMVGFTYKTVVVEVQGQAKDTVNITYEILNDKCCDQQSRILTTTVDGLEGEYSYSAGINIKIID